MNLHGLRLFYEVAKSGSMTKAAEVLRVSQPAISSQLKQFERDIGISLFNRNGKKFSLTEFGIALTQKADLFFSYEEQIEEFIEDYRLARKGRLNITATYLPANFLIPRWAAAYKSENQDVEINITTTNSKEAFEQLIHHKADVAMYAGGTVDQQDEVEWEQLFEDEIWFVVSPHHKFANQHISLSEVVKEPFVMREKGSSTRERLFSLCQTYQVSTPKISLQYNGLNEAIQSVMTGYGVNFVSSLVVKDLIQNHRLARVYVDTIEVKNKIAICTRKGERLSKLVKDFIKVCKIHKNV